MTIGCHGRREWMDEWTALYYDAVLLLPAALEVDPHYSPLSVHSCVISNTHKSARAAMDYQVGLKYLRSLHHEYTACSGSAGRRDGAADHRRDWVSLSSCAFSKFHAILE